MLPGYYYGSVIHLYSWSCGSLFHTFSTKHSTIHLPVSCSPDNLLAISLEEKKKKATRKEFARALKTTFAHLDEPCFFPVTVKCPTSHIVQPFLLENKSHHLPF